MWHNASSPTSLTKTTTNPNLSSDVRVHQINLVLEPEASFFSFFNRDEVSQVLIGTVMVHAISLQIKSPKLD